MTWHLQFTRFASAHMVRQQEAVNSCGIACILMINFKMKKALLASRLAAGAAVSAVPIPGASYLGATMAQQAKDWALQTEPEVYKIYGDVVGTTYDGTSYTRATKHPPVLNKLGLGLWSADWVGASAMGLAIKEAIAGGAPCIVHVTWAAGGAHFVCIDDVFTSPGGTEYAAVNDPSDGEVNLTQITDGATISYLNNTGSFSGWIVKRS